jgi:CRISPR-associated endoribonuclease Cas6
MRLHITLEAERPVMIPVNYQEYLTAAIYGYVGVGDAEYAKFVHDDGYVGDNGRTYKPFTHGWLRIPGNRRRVVDEQMHISPGQIFWQVSSPLDDFLRPFATGLTKSRRLRIGTDEIYIAAVGVTGSPEITDSMTFTCLSPIVATARRDDGTTQFLRPLDDPAAFSEAIRKNAVAKYRALTKREPSDTSLTLTFDANYLEINRGGTKKARYKNIDVIGILAPFTLTGSADLIRLGLEAGLGGKNACGFGCVELAQRRK